MTAPTSIDAAKRRPVRLADGRTARVVYVPSPGRRRLKGSMARVLLPSGRYLSVDPASLVVLEEPVS